MAHRNPLPTVARVVAWFVVGVFVILLSTIASLFLFVASLPWEWARFVLVGAFVVATVSLFIFLKPRWKAALAFLGLFGAVFLWYWMIPASNDRQWQPDVARVVSVDINGDIATIHNIRDFRYRSETDYDESWETRTYDLSTLSTVDLCFSYWGPRDIAHTMLSFGFENGDYLVVSVEARKEVGEA